MTAVREMSFKLLEEGPLARALRAAHQTWIREINEFLMPLTAGQAPFWDRWTAVRYLADQFMGQYRRECALVDELRPYLSDEVGQQLVEQGRRIRGLQEAIDRLGRTHGAERTVLVIGRGLLESVRDWCGGIEAAVAGLGLDPLPEEIRRLIIELKLYAVHP